MSSVSVSERATHHLAPHQPRRHTISKPTVRIARGSIPTSPTSSGTIGSGSRKIASPRWRSRSRSSSPFDEVTTARLGDIFELYRTAITPYYLCLIDFDNPLDPLRVQSVPTVEELLNPGELTWDPLNEEGDSPVTGIVHRYPDRCLFLVTSYCPLYCRYCTRKRKWVDEDGTTGQRRIETMIQYVAEHPEIRDVIVSGGDPLSLSLTYLEKILAGLRAIPHVEIIRFGSRVPVFLPQRIDDEMCSLLEKYHPIWINTHFNHPNEITPESAAACDRLLRAGIPVNNQAVLLRGVNDCPYTMRDLVQGLMKIRVRPYYLYLCDQVMGAEHFRTSVGEGIEIIEFLRGHTSGLAVPQFVMDAPGGGGKVPLMPNYLLGHYGDSVVYRNFEGVIGRYDDVPSAHRTNATAAAIANTSKSAAWPSFSIAPPTASSRSRCATSRAA